MFIYLDENYIKISDNENKVSIEKNNSDADYLYMKLNEKLLLNILKVQICSLE